MRVKKNGVTVEERDEEQQPYKLWDADLYICDECEVEVITGFGRTPLAEHYQPTYQAAKTHLAPIYPGRCAQVYPPSDQDGDEAYERAAARARLNDFVETGGKDWT